MERIHESDLKELCNTINRITNSPMEPYAKLESSHVSNIGNFHLSFAYGGVTLHRMCNEGGGISTPIGGGYYTKRELYYKMHDFIRGLTFDK